MITYNYLDIRIGPFFLTYALINVLEYIFTVFLGVAIAYGTCMYMHKMIIYIIYN